jgi:acetyl esterase/lipase
MKYAINKEFGIFAHVASPINNPNIAGFLGSLMRTPKRLFRDAEIEVERRYVKSFDGKDVEVLVISERARKLDTLPALVYFHGGGFMFGAGPSHYNATKAYAIGAGIKVVFVQYRLAPKHKFPIPPEDCYAAYQWTLENAESLGIDSSRVAVGGDSAGGALAAAVSLMARDRGIRIPYFQLLIYPVADRRKDTESNRRFTDTPMWNSRLSRGMWRGYAPEVDKDQLAYASPAEARDFSGLPDAYVELAEFDCLHDEGLALAGSLESAGAEVVVNDIKGTMHGFDTVEKAPTSKAAIQSRIEYMKGKFA